MSSNKNKRVIYLRDDAASRYDLSVQSNQHPMKPFRLTAVHGVVRRLGLHKKMKIMTPPQFPAELMKDFHLNEYVEDLEKASADCWRFAPIDANAGEWIPLQYRGINYTTTTTNIVPENSTSTNSNNKQENEISSTSNQNQNNIHEIQNKKPLEKAPSCFSPYDCPVMQGGLEYSRIVAGSSLFAAVLLNSGAADTVINWQGGMHHARAGTCSGFCYVNDCVIAIRELMRAHDRILYVDLDVHHGDGVEEAFYDSNRVFTLSLHKFADSFFPGTGHPADVGVDAGRYFNMNVPLRDGIRDSEYLELFEAAFDGIVEIFKPEVVVVQCGADSLAGDRVGGACMRLSSAGHASCVRRIRDSGLKILALGGGGYSIRNVSRLWAFETAVLCGVDDDEIHSRSLFSLPENPHQSVLNFFEKVEENILNNPDADEIQRKLEERALLMVFPDSSLVSGFEKEDEDKKNNKNYVSLFISSDEGGFEVRQAYSSLSSSGGLSGAVVMQRFVQTTLRRIQEHLNFLKQRC